LNVSVHAVIRAVNQKAIVEERREKLRRVITATILKVQVVLQKMTEILISRPFDPQTFKKYLTTLVQVYKEVHPFLPTQTKASLIDFTVKVLNVAKVFDEGKVYPKDRIAFEKLICVTVQHLLSFRDSI